MRITNAFFNGLNEYPVDKPNKWNKQTLKVNNVNRPRETNESLTTNRRVSDVGNNHGSDR